MDGSHKGLPSSTSPKPSAIPKLSPSGGSNENDENYDQMGSSKLQNPKKPSMKHFMSPTISAASKASVPRKKILAERNEASTFTSPHLPKTPNLDSKSSPLNSGIDRSDKSSSRAARSYSFSSESGDDEHSTFVADSSLKPYDPLTNYLSPRPKYLRYKPNRRRETILRHENEIREGKDGFGVNRGVSFDSQKVPVEDESPTEAHGFSVSSSQDGSVKQEGEETDKIEDDPDDEVEESEEFEEEKEWNLEGVLKFLLVLVVLFLSTLHISSMNSPTPSPIQQAIWGLRDNCHQIHNHIFGAVSLKVFEGGSESLEQGETQICLAETTQRESDYGFGEEEIVEDYVREWVSSSDDLGKVLKLQNVQSEDVCYHESVKTQGVFDQLQLTETDESDDVSGHEFKSKEEGSHQLLGPHTAESQGLGNQELEQMGEGSDQWQGSETADKPESFQDYQIPVMSDWADHHDTVYNLPSGSQNAENGDLNSKDGHNESEHKIEPVEGISNEGAGKEMVENELKRAEAIARNAIEEIVISGRADNESTESDTMSPETEVTAMELLNKHVKIGVTPIVIIGVCICFTVLTSLVFFHRSRQKKNTSENSLPKEKPLAKSVTAEEITPVLANVEEEHNEKVESFLNPLSLTHSVEASKEFSHSHAPVVELLGELVLGEVSSSLKSCATKSKGLVQTKESNDSDSQQKGSRAIGHVVFTQAQPSVMELSTTQSPSYESFTAEKKMEKKEQEVVATPVRRSSRIRNRAVMSP